MPVDLWSFESRVYPKIDATGMRYIALREKYEEQLKKEKFVEMKFALGEGNNVAVKIGTLDDEPLSNSRKVQAKNLMFRMNFWKDGENEWYRVDSDYGLLHFHLEKEGQSIKDHIPLPEDNTISELVSYAFDKAEKFLLSKGIKISEGEGFAGFA